MTVHSNPALVMQAPDPQNTRALRDAFGQFATGVTVITTQGADGPVAITANSFTSVSLDPALVLWCLGHASNRYESFRGSEHFSIHVLGADGEEACALFARDGAALAHWPHAINRHGVPVLENCLARFDCVQHQLHPAGDHDIIIGRVLEAGYRSGPALGFFQGNLGPYPV